MPPNIHHCRTPRRHSFYFSMQTLQYSISTFVGYGYTNTLEISSTEQNRHRNFYCHNSWPCKSLCAWHNCTTNDTSTPIRRYRNKLTLVPATWQWSWQLDKKQISKQRESCLESHSRDSTVQLLHIASQYTNATGVRHKAAIFGTFVASFHSGYIPRARTMNTTPIISLPQSMHCQSTYKAIQVTD